MNTLELLKENDFEFKKKFGQNFITDTNLLKAICAEIGINKEDEILEIGVGAGTLTRVLCENSKKVLGIEIDKNLEPVIKKQLENYNNFTIFFDDFMNTNSEKINSYFDKPFKVVANLPYYITTPIIFKLIEENFNIESINIMVQTEVAERIIAKNGSKQFGTISAELQSIADCKILRKVNRNMFIPVPNVDSAIVQIIFNKNKFKIDNLLLHRKVIDVAFSMRRKTLSNCLKAKLSLSNQQIENLFNELKLDKNIRGEALTIQEFVNLSNLLNKILN